ESSAGGLISSIVAHTDNVLFGAACPGQPGQHHVNCQWPIYWQGHFNRHGFVCDDSIRWQIWDNSKIEWGYLQNMFWARRDPSKAGGEPRLRSAVVPDLVESVCISRIQNSMKLVEDGSEPLKWYLTVSMRVIAIKLARRVGFWQKRRKS